MRVSLFGEPHSLLAQPKSFDGGRFRPAALSPAEGRLARGLPGRTLTHPEMPRAVANDLPDWLEPYLDKVYGRRRKTRCRR